VGLDLNHPHNHDSKDLRENLKPLTRSEPTRPVAWIDKFGDGRVFYSNFGHNNTTYWNPIILQHYLDGIQFALGDIEAETMPSGELLTTELRSAPSSK
jgi:type 1 glutamine amidotransferase